ncbi:hypothetical protein BWZ22_07745 [Seonamhaeicola sp. S2-3]|uniref:hypothetical protein n=1 Tax=Seonamhaeicola sp. S2-3 TaxID=1936081 RepID=UPI000972D2CD|nr:hypothetical protein [Seonamhaeicola sp. S2-3]APY11141.1 hypothetical protein BWZ22_07745 [Seonamhaeicola sp. S2-3]
MKKRILCNVLVFLLFFFIGALGFSQSIFTNSITGANPSASNPYTTGQVVNSNITVTGIGRGSGITEENTNDRYSASSWAQLGINSNDYFEFTITPNTNYKIDFTSFEFTLQSSAITGPTSYVVRSSLDAFTSNLIGSLSLISLGGTNTSTVDLSSVTYQNITAPITFRIYAWGGTLGLGILSVNSFTFNGTVSRLSTTWIAGSWTSGIPTIGIDAIIADDYNTSVGGAQGSFSAHSLTVNNGETLTVANNTFIEVENDVVVDGGTIAVETHGAFVQNGTGGSEGIFSIINSGNAYVNKTTKPYSDYGLHYVYWGTPVKNANITTVFPTPDGNRRYEFNASAFLDQHTVGTTNGIPDDIDDDANDWVIVSGTMTPGHGYAVTASAPPPTPFPFPYIDNAQFSGEFNTGDINVTVYRNDDETNDSNWNLLGNPYPSAISTDEFFAVNGYNSSTNPTGAIANIIYLWTHNSEASQANPGNEGYNFSQDDYAMINLSGSNSAAISGGDMPNDYIPSGQGFFVEMSDDVTPTGGADPIFSATVTFNNDMRRADGTSNSQFFKNSVKKSNKRIDKQRLWVNLTSDNGVFNQILIAYVDGATNQDDGVSYDARRINNGNASILYSIIEGSDKKFAIQGKAASSLNEEETIALGFKTNIDVPTLYTMSLADIQGDFLSGSPVYLKDNLLNKVHDLSVSDYTFTSEVGEFNERFVIGFSNSTLSTDTALTEAGSLKIVALDSDYVQFSTSNDLQIKSVAIYDLLGRALYNFKGSNSSETYKLSNLKSPVFLAKVELSNGAVISKKAVKK